MQSLRSELFEVDRNLRESQKCVDTLQSFTLEFRANLPGDNDRFSSHTNPLFHTSDSSQDYITTERGGIA
jgi:hypothetical protein